MNFKGFIEDAQAILGCILIAVGLVIPIAIRFTNIDMTETRLVVEFWHVFLLCVISMIGGLALLTGGD